MDTKMHYFLDPTGGIYAFSDAQIEMGYPLTPMAQIPESGVEAHLNPKLTLEQASILERHWRDNELNRADIQLNKVQDGMSGLGTVTAWRQYRVDLRNLPEIEGFPETSIRPVAPDAL